MPELKDLSKQKFDRWNVICRAEDKVSKNGSHHTAYKCVCDCGTERIVDATSLLSGKSKSCGCLGRETSSRVCRNNFKTHGETKTRLYQIYAGIKKRCLNTKAYNYMNYGGRGISICEEWLNSWRAFRDWSYLNGYSDELSIDRIDVNGNYSPDNCRWVDRVAQANNRRSSRNIVYNDETHTIAEWAKILDIPYKRLHKWISKGKTMEEIMATQQLT